MTVTLLPNDPHDQQLREHTHPAEWPNPTPTEKYNLVVIGGGTAGLVCAAGAAGLGAKVALIERDLLGGDCLNVGCVPSKAILRASRAVHAVRQSQHFGVKSTAAIEVDFPWIMQQMRRLRAELSPHDSAQRFQGLGVDVFFGEATFRNSQSVEVAGQVLLFHRAVIATGSTATLPNIPGLTDVPYYTNANIFSLTKLPKRLAIIGAGPIGVELAQAFARFGSQVHLLCHSFLAKENPDAAALVQESLERDGVQLHRNAEVATVRRSGAEKILELRQGTVTTMVHADDILVAVGRTPNVAGLGLESIGVDFDHKNGVRVDDFLRTSVRTIYAAGDVCSAFQFTHAADAMARIVLQNALFRGRSRFSQLVIPRCTYTDPEIAQVGLTRQQAEQQHIRYRVFRQELAKVDRAILEDESNGFAEVLLHPRKDRILGATIVATHAGEMIPEIVLAMTQRFGLSAIAKTIHCYPTQAEAIKKLGDIYNRTRLTPRVQWLFRQWLRWSRS